MLCGTHTQTHTWRRFKYVNNRSSKLTIFLSEKGIRQAEFIMLQHYLLFQSC